MKFYYPRVVRTFDGIGNVGNDLLAPPGTPGAAAASNWDRGASAAAASSMNSNYGREEQGFGPYVSTAPGMAEPAQQAAAESKPTGSFKSGRETTGRGIATRKQLWNDILVILNPGDNKYIKPGMGQWNAAQYQEIVRQSTSLRPTAWAFRTLTPGQLAVVKPDIEALQSVLPKEYAAGFAAGKAEQVIQPDSVKTLAPIIDEDLPLLAIAFVKGTEQKLRVPGGTITLTAAQIRNSSLDIYNFLKKKFGGKILQTVLENAAAGIKDLPAGYVEMKRQAGLDYSVSPEPVESEIGKTAGRLPSTTQNSGGTFKTQSMDTTNADWGKAQKQADQAQKAVEDAAIRDTQEASASSSAALEQAKRDAAAAEEELKKLKQVMAAQASAQYAQAAQAAQAAASQGMQYAQQGMQYAQQYASGGVEPVGNGGISVPGLNVPAYQMPQVSKPALSTGAMIGIGVGAAALLGLGVWAAMRKR